MHRVSLPIVCCLLAACPGDDDGDGGPVDFRPAPGTTWQWQLSDLPIDVSIDAAVYDIDLFTTRQEEIDALHRVGRAVICYFSAGSFEDGRPDSAAFPDAVKGDPIAGFEDELWLDIRTQVVRDIMLARLDLAATKQCDAVEPDNVDGFANPNGFGLGGDDQLDFNRFLAAEARSRGLSVGLKNDMDQIADLQDSFDWALNEECFIHEECDLYADTFIAAGKAVFHAEYVPPERLAEVCEVTRPLGLSTLVKNLDLDAYRLTCPGAAPRPPSN